MDGVRALRCREVVELVSDYLEGRLRGADRTLFEHHASWCRWCSDYLREMRATVGAAAKLRRDGLPKELEEAFLHLYREWRR